MPSTAEPTVLVDAMNLAVRMHFVFRNLSSAGEATGLLHGAIKTVHALREAVSTRLVFCWDDARPYNWRSAILPSYKATRHHDGDERACIAQQLPVLQRMLQCLGYANISVAGTEADDVISILANMLPGTVLLFSTDKDLYQLLTPRVHMLVPKQEKSGFRRITVEDVEKRYGVAPERWAEYLALGGDSSDNIKPRRGMGPKTAIKLIQAGAQLDYPFDNQSSEFRSKYRDLEEIWESIQKSYAVARIPQHWSDPRLRRIQAPTDFRITPEQYWESESVRRSAQQEFAQFCADRELLVLLSLRHKLFGRRVRAACAPPSGVLQQCIPIEHSEPPPCRLRRNTLV